MNQQIKSRGLIVASVMAVVGVALAPIAVSAGTSPQQATTVINATLGTSIGITNTTPITLAINPVSGGAQSTALDTVGVSTNAANGYTLKMKDSDANTNLVFGGNNIAASTNSTWGTAAALSTNTWGYAIPSGTAGLTATSGFDAAYSVASDVIGDTHKFMGITTTDQLVRTHAGAVSGTENTSVYYSAKADTSLPIGTYSGGVTYTATATP